MFLKHSLVAYKNRPALIIENSPDLQIELEDGRTQNVRSKDIILIHPGPVLNIAHLEPQSGDAETAWELLSHDAVTLRELAELAFGRFTPSTAWGAWQLICDSLYFQGTPDCITACSTLAPHLGQKLLFLPSLVLQWGQASFRRVFRC